MSGEAPVWEAVIRLAASDVLNLNDRRHWSQATGRRRAIRQAARQTALVGRAPGVGATRAHIGLSVLVDGLESPVTTTL